MSREITHKQYLSISEPWNSIVNSLKPTRKLERHFNYARTQLQQRNTTKQL